MITLNKCHIEDLTTPRYEYEIWNGVEWIIDTHFSSNNKLRYKKDNLIETVDELNRDYHNHVIRVLGYDSSLDLAVKLSAINRSSW